jgi:hypothetical protein
VDGRDEPGHDEKKNRFQLVRKSLKMLDAFSVRLSKRLLLVAAFLAGEFHAGRAFFSRDAIWRAAFSASSLDPGIAPVSRQGPCVPWFRESGARPLRASTASTSACTRHENRSRLIALTLRLAAILLQKNASGTASLLPGSVREGFDSLFEQQLFCFEISDQITSAIEGLLERRRVGSLHTKSKFDQLLLSQS